MQALAEVNIMDMSAGASWGGRVLGHIFYSNLGKLRSQVGSLHVKNSR